ncbi:MAG: hypothetical protein LC541_04575 [Candidatus Thiodiazotropha sp.]|nr:hypothetical protein [Candidatus Thiodiazotropha sp.]MCM8882592.1 hypothetical protein [Candidatus Thiodiazotropha sp.]
MKLIVDNSRINSPIISGRERWLIQYPCGSIIVSDENGGFDLAYADPETRQRVIEDWAKWRRQQDEIESKNGREKIRAVK